MKIIVVGAGKIGTFLIKTLVKEKHDIVLIDTDQKTLDYVVNKYDVIGVLGSGSARKTLEEAGVKNADLLVACTSKDEVNILCCLLAKKLGVKYTGTRVRNPEYFHEYSKNGEYLDIDLVFNPEYRTAVEISRILKFPSAFSVENFSGGKILIVGFKLAENNPLIGRSVAEAVHEYGVKVLFGLVTRNGESIIPKGNFVFKEGDLLYITAPENDVYAFCKKTELFKPRAKSAFIIGGGIIGYYLAEILCEEGVSVKIIEQNEARSEELATTLPDATVVLGDGTNSDILKEERIEKYDSCVALTGVDEENVMLSLYASRLGVDKVIAKVDRESVLEIVDRLGLDTTVTPGDIVAGGILRFVRAFVAEETNGMRELLMLEENVEAYEFTISDSFEKKGIPLKELPIKENTLITAIVKGKSIIIPTGESTFEDGDKVIVIVNGEKITDFSDIFE